MFQLTLPIGEAHVVLSCGEDAHVYHIDVREPSPNRILICRNAQDRKVPLYSIHSDPDRPHLFCVSGRDTYVNVYDRRVSFCTFPYCRQRKLQFLSSTMTGVNNDDDASPTKPKGNARGQRPVTIYCPHKLENAQFRPHVTCAVYNYNGSEILASYNDDDL